MNNLKGSMMNETEKLFSKKKTKVSLILLGIISFLPAFFLSIIKQKFFFAALDALNYPSMMLSVMTNIFIPLFIFMAVAELFSGEVGEGTMKLSMMRPISRFKLYLSKSSAVVIYTFLSLGLVFMTSTVTALLLHLQLNNLVGIAFSYVLDSIPMLVVILFAAFIAQFFRNSSTALIAGILLFIGIRVIAFFSTTVNNSLFTSYLNWSSQWTLSGSVSLVSTIILLSGYVLVFFISGFYLFDKQEL